MDSASSPPFILWLGASVAVNGKSGTKRLHLGAHLALDLGVAVRAVFRDAVEHVGDQMADLAEFSDAEAARRAGRPCRPGNTAELIFLPMSGSVDSTMPPRGPRRVLCVVVVTTWACGNGLG